MKKKMFGNNIETSCKYCDNSTDSENGFICRLNKSIKNGKCRKFKYNPTMRIPLEQVSIGDFSKEDFTL